MEKQQCGECKLEINDLEPVRCGFCDTSYHISQQCCGFNGRATKELFSHGKAMFICPACRGELKGRSIHAYLADTKKLQPSESSDLDSLPAQVQKLFALVEMLSKKIESLPARQTQFERSAWPNLGAKRRRDDRGERIEAPVVRGTKKIDFSDLSLSIPSLTPPVEPPKFWLYVAGWYPTTTVDDMRKIVPRCLGTTEPVDVFRLVARDRDISRMKSVSFKIGLDPSLKEEALAATSWPDNIIVREFFDRPKNWGDRRPPVFKDNEATPRSGGQSATG